MTLQDNSKGYEWTYEQIWATRKATDAVVHKCIAKLEKRLDDIEEDGGDYLDHIPVHWLRTITEALRAWRNANPVSRFGKIIDPPLFLEVPKAGPRTMILRNDADYRGFAAQCLCECDDKDEAFKHYMDECNALYDEDDDGQHAAYVARMWEIFRNEVDWLDRLHKLATRDNR